MPDIHVQHDVKFCCHNLYGTVPKLKFNKDNFSKAAPYKCFATVFYLQRGGAEVLCPGDEPAAAGGEAHHVEGHAHRRTDQEGEQHPGHEKSSFFKERWVAKLVARLLAAADLWVRIQTSLKNSKWATQAKEWPTHSEPFQKNLQKREIFFWSAQFNLLLLAYMRESQRGEKKTCAYFLIPCHIFLYIKKEGD